MTKETFVMKFRRNANSLATLYGVPVWLVGGALTDEHPRDFDVRVILSEADHKKFFKGSYLESRTTKWLEDFEDWEWLRAYECLKMSRIQTYRMSCRVDFQIQSETEAEHYKDMPKERLDTTPDWVMEAGLDKIPKKKSPHPSEEISSPAQSQSET